MDNMQMAMMKKEKGSKKSERRKKIIAEVCNTFEWLITAFILAFVFRAFVMEAFRIPTGSMANTLKGAHFRLCCPQCGHKYDRGFVPQEYGQPSDTVPWGIVRPPSSRCPSCGYYPPNFRARAVCNGDRILVFKCIYQFFEPKQWDVVVFKNPVNPSINYIKRLVGRPGEKVEIIDGDVYINGSISRKPPKVQKELWMPVYNNDYQPSQPLSGYFNNHHWEQPFKNVSGSGWETSDGNGAPVFLLDSSAEQINTLLYDTSGSANNFKTAYSYNDVRAYSYMPTCSDLMVRFFAEGGGESGSVGAVLSKYGTRYEAMVDMAGEMIIKKINGNEEKILDNKFIDISGMNKPTLFKFTNVDHQLVFQFGSEKLVYDMGRRADDMGVPGQGIQPEVGIVGSGKIKVSHVAIFRDIHYTNEKFNNGPECERATQSHPLILDKDEFFVLGDNSPNSEDGRWWSQQGVGNNGRLYREGIVPREYLVGKAIFVYWPSGFKPFIEFPLSIILDIGQMRFIYGGSYRNL